MKIKSRTATKRTKTPVFVARAERAFRRVARQVRSEYAKADVPMVFGDKKRVRLVRAR